jgi:CubicO group peptidase (beta-lactamase class C family)
MRKVNILKNFVCRHLTLPRASLYLVLLITGLLLFAPVLSSCGPSADDLKAVYYAPTLRDDWEVSTPEEQGLDPLLVAKMYYNAAKHDTIYSLLVVKNGRLIAEKYLNKGSIDELGKRASVTKSYTSSLVGIALDKGYLASVDQKMLDFFPDVSDQITDPRKEQITIRDMLEMRSGYPGEEHNAAAWDALWSGEYLTKTVGIPLTADPGTSFQYSNLTANWLGIIAARATGMDLMTLGNKYLFRPLGVVPGKDWLRDVDGYYIGCGDILFTARDMARFGQLYLDGGSYKGEQLIPADWVHDSLQTYTVNEFEVSSIGRFKNMGYGYMWWSAKVGDRYINFAWGHGGQLIVLDRDNDIVVVTTADPFWGKDIHFDAWKYESAILRMVSDFIYALPAE